MKNEPIESGVEGRVGYQMKRAQQVLRIALDEALREVGMTTAQYAALSALETTPVCRGPSLPGDASSSRRR